MGRDGPNDPRALQHLRHRPKPTNPRPNLMRSGNRSSPAYGWNCGHGSSTAQRRRARSPRPRRAHQRSAASVRVQARLLNPSETKSNRQRADKHYGQSDNEHSARSRRIVKHSPPPSSPPQSRWPSPYALVATKSHNRDCPQLFTWDCFRYRCAADGDWHLQANFWHGTARRCRTTHAI
jgi:hypothetical protein